MNRARRRIAGGLITVVLLGVACAPRRDAATIGSKDQYTFDSLPQMIATSTVVVEANVASVELGRVVGTGDGALQFTQVSLKVDGVLFGTLQTSSVTIEEGGLEGNHPSKVGDHGIYFLHLKDDGSGYFRLVNPQGRFLQTTSGTLSAIDNEAQWVKNIEDGTLAQLKANIAIAASAVVAGRVTPASPAL